MRSWNREVALSIGFTQIAVKGLLPAIQQIGKAIGTVQVFFEHVFMVALQKDRCRRFFLQFQQIINDFN